MPITWPLCLFKLVLMRSLTPLVSLISPSKCSYSRSYSALHRAAASRFQMLQAPRRTSVDSGLDMLARELEPGDHQQDLKAPPALRDRPGPREVRLVDNATQTDKSIDILLAWAFVTATKLFWFDLLVEFLMIQLEPCWSSYPFPVLFQLSRFEFICICICICIVAIHIQKHKRSISSPFDGHRLLFFSIQASSSWPSQCQCSAAYSLHYFRIQLKL